MNKDWARERLNKYLAAIRTYKAFLQSDEGFSQQAYERVISLEPAAKTIMKRVNPAFEEYSFIHTRHSLWPYSRWP